MNNDLVFYDNYPSIAYAPKDGYICRVNKDKEFIRKLIPDENGMLNIFVLDMDAFTNRKAINLAYEIFNKRLYQKDTLCITRMLMRII